MIKKKFWNIIADAALILLNYSSYGQPTTYDLALKKVKVFDSKKKKVQANKTILIKADTIAAIVNSSRDKFFLKFISISLPQ